MQVNLRSESRGDRPELYPVWPGIERYLELEKKQKFAVGGKRKSAGLDLGNGIRSPSKRKVSEAGEYIGRVPQPWSLNDCYHKPKKEKLIDSRQFPMPGEDEAWENLKLMRQLKPHKTQSKQDR